MIRIGLLYGGNSSEHDVSLCSAASVYSAMDKDRYEIIPIGIDRDGKWHVQEKAEITDDASFGKILALKQTGNWLVNHFNNDNRLTLHNLDDSRAVEVDFVFPMVHGSNCEDGRLQGLLELAGVPYAGADLTGSAIAMDKDVAKRLLKLAGIPVVPWMSVVTEEWENGRERIIPDSIDRFGLPLFVKPNAAGSSVGISKVKERSELPDAAANAFLFDNKILIEKAIDCREVECSVLGNEKPEVSITGQIIPKHEFYSYDAKYIDSNGAELLIPADIDKSASESIRKTALEAYKTLCCSGMARIDFFLEKGSGSFYLNEINTLPGFTSISMYPKLWENTGLAYSRLIDRLIELGFEQQKARARLKTRP